MRLHANYLMLSAKLISEGSGRSKVAKVYGRPTTPYRRLHSRDDIDDEAKTALAAQFETLNPTGSRDRISRLQDEFYMLNAREHARWNTEVQATDVEYMYCESTNQLLEHLDAAPVSWTVFVRPRWPLLIQL